MISRIRRRRCIDLKFPVDGGNVKTSQLNVELSACDLFTQGLNRTCDYSEWGTAQLENLLHCLHWIVELYILMLLPT